MASSRFIAEDVVDVLFDDDFGLSDEDNSDEEDGDRIYGYLGSSFFTDDAETQLEGDELETGEVESIPDSDGHAVTEAETLTEDEEEIADEVRSPDISESDDSFVVDGTRMVDDHMDVDEVGDNDSSQNTIADNTVSIFIHLHVQYFIKYN